METKTKFVKGKVYRWHELSSKINDHILEEIYEAVYKNAIDSVEDETEDETEESYRDAIRHIDKHIFKFIDEDESGNVGVFVNFDCQTLALNSDFIDLE